MSVAQLKTLSQVMRISDQESDSNPVNESLVGPTQISGLDFKKGPYVDIGPVLKSTP
jgi:hypothetical protein